MRVVTDTNVFASILICPGDTFLSLIDYIDRDSTILYSAETLTEPVDVLRRAKFARYTTPKDVSAFVAWVIATGELVIVEQSVTGSRDPKDNNFLALAIAGQADYLASGDKDLLVLRHIGETAIVSPSGFLTAVEQ